MPRTWYSTGSSIVMNLSSSLLISVQRGRLARARRTRDQHHAVRFMNVTAEAIELFGGETNHVQSQVRKFFGKCFFV